MRRLICRLLGHDFCPHYDHAGRLVEHICWRCHERWPS